MIKLETIKSAILGFAVADALGVPVEFKSRTVRENDPVTDMRSFGSWDQPVGTWSDDTSMTIATMESIARLKKVDYTDIMGNFVKWLSKAAFTAGDKTFDVGITTHDAISNYVHEVPALLCGGSDERSNGNGSLMRILPIAFYNYNRCEIYFDNNAMDTIHDVSALTHAHPRSLIACGIYCLIAAELLDGQSIQKGIANGLQKAKKYYQKYKENADDFKFYERLYKTDFAYTYEDDIKSTGYVVDTLEAVIWCLLNTDDYKSAVLKAVNLGGDTDTIAAITGGLAGIAYGLEQIPADWLAVLQKKDYLENICQLFYNSLKK